MAARFSRFYEKRPYESGSADIFDYEDSCIDEPQVEKAALDTHLPEENVGYQIAVRMGWISGKGLGRKNQGRVDPLPLVMKEDLLCIGRMQLEMDQAEEATEKRKTMEIEKKETEKLKQKYQNEQEKEKAIEDSLKHLKDVFYCDLCDKQYFKYKEYDNHINSYDHAHRQRLKDLKSRESTRNIYAKKKREQKQMEKELQRLHLIAEKNAEQKTSASFQPFSALYQRSVGDSPKGGFKPMASKATFSAVPPPPPDEHASLVPLNNNCPPPLPSEPAPPPLPAEDDPVLPPLPPQDNSDTAKPFSFSLTVKKPKKENTQKSNTNNSRTSLSFGLNKRNVLGAKGTLVKKALSVFEESDSEEEDDSDNLNIITPQEHVATTSTVSEQQELLEKAMDYADTLKRKEALRPKLLIQFVRGSVSILPGTIPAYKGTTSSSAGH